MDEIKVQIKAQDAKAWMVGPPSLSHHQRSHHPSQHYNNLAIFLGTGRLGFLFLFLSMSVIMDDIGYRKSQLPRVP